MALAQKWVVDEATIEEAIELGHPFTITTFSLSHEIEVYIDNVITIFLKWAQREKLKDYICYCVRELAANAKKANTKRVYFIEQGLNIDNPKDYQKGMEHFKKATLDNMAYYIQQQKKKRLYIKLILQIRENTFYIEVRNNAAITRAELTRVYERLARSHQYNDFEDALAHPLDDSEGSGLGLVILALMLKKMGLTEDHFAISSSKTETIAQISIPFDNVHYLLTKRMYSMTKTTKRRLMGDTGIEPVTSTV